MSKIAGQFAKPRGLFGRFVGLILANRPSNVRRAHWTVDRLALSRGDRVLEIGCGPGVALKACLTIMAEAGDVVGVDHSDVMIKLARRRNSRGPEQEAQADYGHHRRCSSGRGSLRPDLLDQRDPVHCRQGGVRRQLRETPRSQRRVGHDLSTADQALARGGMAMATTLTEVKAQAGLTRIRTEVLELKPVPAICVLAQKA